MLALSFPKFNQALLAWLAPGLILLVTDDASSKRILLNGFAAGLGNYLVSLIWMLASPLPVKALPGYVIVCAIQSGYVALWCLACWKLFPRPSVAAGEPAANLVAQFSGLKFRQRITWPFVCAASWVAMEMCMARCFIGFPWNLLGASQYHRLPLIQIASLTGVYGVSFLLAWMSVSLLVVIALLRGGLKNIGRAMLQLAVPGIACLCVLYYGSGRLNTSDAGRLTLRMALVQPAFSYRPADDIATESTRLRELVGTAVKSMPDLIVVPEWAGAGQSDVLTIASLTGTQRTWAVVGSHENLLPFEGKAIFFNGAFLIDPNSERLANPTATYPERHAVLFEDFLSVNRSAQSKNAGVFQIEKPRVRFSPMVAYEDIFPQEVRSRSDASIDFLLHVGSEARIGESAAQWQHAANAVFRAVENGLPLVRCANKGLSCWIDSCGRIHNAYFDNSINVYQAGCKIIEVPLYLAKPGHPSTFYNRHGDWFGWACVGLLGLAIVVRVVRERRNRKPA